MKRRDLTEVDMHKMRIPKRFWTATLDEIGDQYKMQLNAQSEADAKTLKSVIETYISNITTAMSEGVGLFLWGPNGVGKTCAAVVAMMEARRVGYTGLFLESLSMKEVVINREMFDDQMTLWERAKTVDFLLIDDVGKGVQDSKGFGDELVKSILKHRSAEQKVTWITSNMTIQEFKDIYKTTTISSMKESIIPGWVQGADRRVSTAKQIVSLITEKT